ncbi:BC10 family protein [Paenibacillus sp. SYP-B3998]|uniref:BC10 family protein n=1 Tax=Paenibacillus sp. SYP-B3998 TaxID=2678564 RepID=A0A6G4A4N4_9BACL|nr:BC10 family protein [Paenibacillus sp. SYP-B3998]
MNLAPVNASASLTVISTRISSSPCGICTLLLLIFITPMSTF